MLSFGNFVPDSLFLIVCSQLTVRNQVLSFDLEIEEIGLRDKRIQR